MQSFKRCLNYDLQNNISRRTYNMCHIRNKIEQSNIIKINNSVSPPFEMLWYCHYFTHFCSRPDDTEKPSQKKAFVNSRVLSLTTQANIGSLNPPLKLTFQNVQTVRYQHRDNDMCNIVTFIDLTDHLILHFNISENSFRNADIVCLMEF